MGLMTILLGLLLAHFIWHGFILSAIRTRLVHRLFALRDELRWHCITDSEVDHGLAAELEDRLNVLISHPRVMSLSCTLVVRSLMPAEFAEARVRADRFSEAMGATGDVRLRKLAQNTEGLMLQLFLANSLLSVAAFGLIWVVCVGVSRAATAIGAMAALPESALPEDEPALA